ncbi:MAG TPA: O-antigen ligase family protein [Bacteroidetes bacterium]|nr:O-antigen ligase family protein [Bacteroidota bacterium]
MQTLLQSYKAQALVFLFIWLVSMVLSAEFVLSLSMIGLLVLAFFEMEIEGPKVRLMWRRTLRENFRKYWKYKAWLAVSIPFLIVLISVLWSSDVHYTLERLRIKLPFLVLPFAFASMPALRKKEIFTILYFLLVMMCITSLYILIDFLVNFDEVMELLGRGGHLPTPSNHIRFSLTLALTIIGGLALWAEKFYLQQAFEKYIIGGMTLFLFVFIHILSVRSGILALYLGLFVLGAYYIFFKKKYLLGIAGMAAIIALPFIAYKTFPSFKLKIDYAVWDYQQFKNNTGSNYPDSERLFSMKNGLDIAKEHFLFGVGAGDLKKEVKKRYDTLYVGKYNFRMPHNQAISIFAGTGIVGLIVFFIGFFFPLFYKNNFKQPLFLALHAVVFMSFMMENTIENNFGISMYLFFLLIGLNYLSNQQGEEDERINAPFLQK